MRKYFFSLLFISSIAFGQESKGLLLSLGTGVINSSFYLNAKPKSSYNFSMEYKLNQKSALVSDLLVGKHAYYENVRSNYLLLPPIYQGKKITNATARYLIYSIQYKRKLKEWKRISVNVGTGVGLISHTLEYFVVYHQWFENEVVTTQSGFVDLCFPVGLDLRYKVSSRLSFGITSGLYIHPDYPLIGQHVLAKAFYTIK
jgi:hypothetical protein